MDCSLPHSSIHGSGLPFPSPEDLPDPGIESGSPALQADALSSESQLHIREVPVLSCLYIVRFSLLIFCQGYCFFFHEWYWCVSYSCNVFDLASALAFQKSIFRIHAAAAAAKSLQLCPTLCEPIDGSPPGSPVPGILQARILEWVAISFSNACMHAKLLQSYPTVYDPMDSSPPSSSVHKILQARILEWVAISFSLEFICWCNLYYTGIRELLIDIACILCRYSMY